jgi:WD40 repeat protein
MKARLFTFDGRSLRAESVESSGSLRWGCWNRRDGSALLVGDRGTLLESHGSGFIGIQTRTPLNLRCVDYSPDGKTAFACGNAGLALRVEGGEAMPLEGRGTENLRRVAWDPSGSGALFVGNNGAAYVSTSTGLLTVQGADTNLRSIAWHASDGYALVSGNSFRDSFGGLLPSPNLFRFKGGELGQGPALADTRADLVAASWKPDGSSCLLVGYEQTWHTPSLLSYDEKGLTPLPWEVKSVFPTACAWHPTGEYALLGTSAMTDDEGSAALYRFDGKAVEKISTLEGSGVSCITWSKDGVALVVASRSARAYSA